MQCGYIYMVWNTCKNKLEEEKEERDSEGLVPSITGKCSLIISRESPNLPSVVRLTVVESSVVLWWYSLENFILVAVTFTEYAKRKTVTAMDLVYVLKCQGRTIYGC